MNKRILGVAVVSFAVSGCAWMGTGGEEVQPSDGGIYGFEDRPVTDRVTSFSALDVNSDGVISRREAAGLPHLYDNFTAYDRTGSGDLTRAEFAAFQEDVMVVDEVNPYGDYEEDNILIRKDDIFNPSR